MTDSQTPNPEAIKALAEALAGDPELASKLVQVTSAKERLSALEMRIAALSEDNAEAMTKGRLAFREKHAPTFADVDVKKVLVGFPVQHRVTIKDVFAVNIQPPTAKQMRAVEALDLALAVRPHEAALLAWATEIDTTAMGGQKVNIGSLELTKKLEYLRTLPDMVLARLAEVCVDLNTYLNVCLEIDLGN